MIKIFNSTDKKYNSNGDAVIIPLKCVVKNADNGEFTLNMTCETKYNDVVKDNYIIVVPTPQGEQAFRVRQIVKKGNRLEVTAFHVFYDSENYIIKDSYAVNNNCYEALVHFNLATDVKSPFIVDSDLSQKLNVRCVRKSLKECVEISLEKWGGHLVRDNWSISIYESIARDNGVNIEYRKNLREMTATYDWSDVVTKILPVGTDGIMIDDTYVYSQVQYDVPFTKVVEFQQDINEDDYPTEQEYIAALKTDLYEQAKKYVNEYCYPRVNYSLKASPEDISGIGEVIRVRDTRIGVDLLTQVTGYEYDAFNERYVTIDFGNFQNTVKYALDNYLKRL